MHGGFWAAAASWLRHADGLHGLGFTLCRLQTSPKDCTVATTGARGVAPLNWLHVGCTVLILQHFRRCSPPFLASMCTSHLQLCAEASFRAEPVDSCPWPLMTILIALMTAVSLGLQVIRDKITGKIISREELEAQLEEERKKRDRAKQFETPEWGQGMAQRAEVERRAREMAAEAAAPFARRR